ncbi:MAG: hypothetical protein ABSB40_10580 [Nitrososphaeria archaeon]
MSYQRICANKYLFLRLFQEPPNYDMLPDSFKTVNDHQRPSTPINIYQQPSTAAVSDHQQPPTYGRRPTNVASRKTS